MNGGQTEGLDRVAAYILSCVFHPDHLGKPHMIPEQGWLHLVRDVSYWSDRVLDAGAASGGAAAGKLTKEFLDKYLEPLQDLLSVSFPVPVSGLNLKGHEVLAAELFGNRSPQLVDAVDTDVADNHIHTGLAYDRRTLLGYLVGREEKFDDNETEEGKVPTRQVILADAIRWSLWILDGLTEKRDRTRPEQDWTMPELIARGGMSMVWGWVTTGDFWEKVVSLLGRAGEEPVDDNDPAKAFLREIHSVRTDRLSDTDIAQARREWQDDPGSKIQGLLKELIDMGITDSDSDYQTANGADWRYTFVINTVRAAVRLFKDVPAWPGEDFTRFQHHCDEANAVRKIVFGHYRKGEEMEARALGASLAEAARRYPEPYRCCGFELRREMDPKQDRELMKKDLIEGIEKRWCAFRAFAQRWAGTQRDWHFCAPISFQRPRQDWFEGSPKRAFPIKDPERVQMAQPWQQVRYAAAAAVAVMDARKAMGEECFDRAVGSFDISGIEIGHATWPYVAAIDWLAEQGVNLVFTAHAGESFERGFSGLRTIGELFMGQKPPQRIGHALALDSFLRDIVADHHKHALGEPALYRFDDLLLDLCYLRYLQELGYCGGENGKQYCDTLICEITCSTLGHFPDGTWHKAFRFLHDRRALEWAIEERRTSPLQWNIENAQMQWRAWKAPTDDRWQRLAIQQLAWGEILNDNDRGYTPKAATEGVDEGLESTIVGYLENYADAVAEYLKGQIRGKGVLIECCPTSNLAITGVRNYKDHPLWGFVNEEIPFSVNCDDPLVFGGFAGDELRALHSTHGCQTEELAKALHKLEPYQRYAVDKPANPDFAHDVTRDVTWLGDDGLMSVDEVPLGSWKYQL